MKRILGQALVAGVVVFGVAACSAPKTYKQSSQQASGQALSRPPAQTSSKASGQAMEPNSRAQVAGADTLMLSEKNQKTVAKLTSKEALARAVVEFTEGMATKEAAFVQMNALGECAGYFKASAKAVPQGNEFTSIGKLMMNLSNRYAITSAVFASKYTNVVKPTVDKVVATATARNTALFRRADAARAEIKAKGEVCLEKAALVGMVTKIVQQTKTK